MAIPIEIEKLNTVKSIADLFEKKFTSFAVYSKHKCQEEIQRFVILMLFKLNKYFAENQQMTDEQIKIAATGIIETYHYLNIGDLKLVFDQLKREKSYGQLSPNKIFNKLENYLTERDEIGYQYSCSEDKKKDLSKEKIDNWYEGVKENGMPEDEKEKMKNKENEFRKVNAEYFRKNAMEEGNENQRNNENMNDPNNEP